MISNHFFLIMRNHYPRNQKHLWIARSMHFLCVERMAWGWGRCLRKSVLLLKSKLGFKWTKASDQQPYFWDKKQLLPYKVLGYTLLELTSVHFLFLSFHKWPAVILANFFFFFWICKYTQIIKDSYRAKSTSIHSIHLADLMYQINLPF